MKKRILSWLLVMCMICSLLPATALAVEDDAGGETTAACTVTDGCTLEAGHEGDCVLPANRRRPRAVTQTAIMKRTM